MKYIWLTNLTAYFCGWCENGFDCLEFGVNSEEECNVSTVCVFADGTTAFNLSQTECEQQFLCNQPCPPRCSTMINNNKNGGICYR